MRVCKQNVCPEGKFAKIYRFQLCFEWPNRLFCMVSSSSLTEIGLYATFSFNQCYQISQITYSLYETLVCVATLNIQKKTAGLSTYLNLCPVVKWNVELCSVGIKTFFFFKVLQWFQQMLCSPTISLWVSVSQSSAGYVSLIFQKNKLLRRLGEEKHAPRCEETRHN